MKTIYISNSSIKLFQVEIITLKLKPTLLLNVSLCIHPLTFPFEMFQLVMLVLPGSPSVDSTTLPNKSSLAGARDPQCY